MSGVAKKNNAGRQAHRQVPRSNRCFGSLLFVFQHVFPKSELLESLRRQNALQAARNLRPGAAVEVERRTDLSEREFVRDYLRKGIPVVFDAQALEWPCTKKWSLRYLEEKFGEDLLPIVSGRGMVDEDFQNIQGPLEETFVENISAGDFVRAVRRGEKKYLRACPILEDRPELIKDLDESWLRKMQRSLLGVGYQCFLGSGGQTTPIHSEPHSFFFIVVEGEKRWTLFSRSSSVILNPVPAGRGHILSRVKIHEPDLKEFPGFDGLTRFTCTLRKGDVLFVPAWMWHEVDTLSESWGVSYRMTYMRGFFSNPSFAFVRSFLVKPSVIETVFYALFMRDRTKRKKNFLVPKLYFR